MGGGVSAGVPDHGVAGYELVQNGRPLRRWLLVWLAPIPLFAIAAYMLVARSAHRPPDGLGGSTIEAPALGSVAWELGWLLMLWTALLGGAFLFSGDRRAPPGFVALLGCTLAPVVLISSLGAYSLARKGCGEPYRELVTPMPAGVEIVSETVSPSAISGPDMTREMRLRSDQMSRSELAQRLAAQLEQLGWQIDDSRSFMTLLSGSSPGGAEWGFTVHEVDDDPNAVVLALNHEPKNVEFCSL